MNNRKGSSTVFLVFILAAMVGVAGVFIYSTRQTVHESIGEGVLTLAMRSVLSEFDIALKDRYGLLGFEKSGMETSLEINDYTDYMFNGKSPVKNIKVDFGDYALSNINTLKSQILDYMELPAAKEMLKNEITDNERTEFYDRTLRNKSVIENLPSIPFCEDRPGFLDKLEQWKDRLTSLESVFDSTSDTMLIDLYILKHFKHAAGGHVYEDTFFDNEVEYIISGSYSNKKNRENVQTGLKVLRTALNTAFIYSDETRRAKTLAAAELLTPEAAPATQAVLITTWASAEAGNDVKLLLKGKPVPLMKSDASWATDLDDVIANLTEDCIDTGNREGLYYSDYLMIFLHFMEEDLKLARIADLIQINLKGTYNGDFLMRTVKGGMYLDGKIYGKEISYETCY